MTSPPCQTRGQRRSWILDSGFSCTWCKRPRRFKVAPPLPPPLLLHALLGSGSWISVAQEGPRPAIFGKHSQNPRSKIRKTAQNLVEADHIWQESKIQNPRSGTRGQGPPPPHGLRRVNLEILDPGSWIFTMTKLGRCFHELRLIRPHEDPPGLPRASRAGPESKVEWGELCEDPQVPSQTGHSVALSRVRILSLGYLKIHFHYLTVRSGWSARYTIIGTLIQ